MRKPSSSQTLITVLAACTIPLATFLATAGVMSIPPDSKGINIVQGQDLFRANCGSCHFAKIGFPAHHGPNLYEIGRTGARRRPGLTAPAYILESILEPSAFVAPSSRPGMPRNVAADLAPDQLRNIIGFLASRGAYPDYDEIASLELPDRRQAVSAPVIVRRSEMEQAVEVMRTKAGCLKCHSQHHTPEANVFAPGIFHVGLTDQRLVRESITEPNREIKAGFQSGSVVLRNGQILSGRLLTQTSQYLLLCVWDKQGSLAVRRIPISDVEHEEGQPLIQNTDASIMPSDFGKLLTDEELESIVTLIHQLN